jgi:tetratricopeptide (TPR) repeat protein
MNRNVFIGLLVGVLAGAAIGFFGANALNKQTAATAPGDAPLFDPQELQRTLPGGDQTAGGGAMPDIQQKLDRAMSEPDSFEAQMEAGDMYAQIQKYETAIEFYQKGIALRPDERQANIVLANAYFDSKKFAEAGKYYAKALELDPNDVNARTDLGTTFVEQQPPDLDRAVEEFKAALEIDPNREATLYNLGVVYFRKGDTENAKEILKRLEAINPNTQLAAKLRTNLFPK